MKKYKLLHFTSSLKIGGAEKILFDLIQNLSHEKYEHIVLYIHDGPYVNTLKKHGIKTIQVRGKFFLYDPWLLIRLWRSIKSLQPDCIHALLWSANLFGRLVARLCGIPCVCVLHNNSAQNGFLRNLLDKLTARFTTSVIAVSEQVAQSAIEYGWIPAKKIAVIKNGIVISSKKNKIARKDLGLLENHFVIGAVGRFDPVKRFDILLNLFAQLVKKNNHLRLILIGIGEAETALRSQAQQLGILQYVIFVVGKSALDYYSLFDCFVQTSIQEGISIALLEAMSFKLPCVVMNTGLQHSVIESGHTGVVVDAFDTDECKTALTELIYNQKKREMLGLYAYQHIINSFSLSTMIARYDSHFDDIIKKQKNNKNKNF